MIFSGVSLPDLARISRGSVFGSIAIGVVGLVLCVVLGAALVGLGLCIGIALGVANFRMVQSSVAKAGGRPGSKRRPLALNTLSRLSIITAIALGLLFVSFDLGFGVMAGLAVFQFLLLLSVVRSILKGGMTARGLAGGSLLSGVGSMFSVDTLSDVGDSPEAAVSELDSPDEGRESA